MKGTNLQTKKDGANLLLIFNLDEIATFLDPFNLKKCIRKQNNEIKWSLRNNNGLVKLNRFVIFFY